jgi:branched-chain amino acid transport system substrate-binding protein
MLCTVLWKEKGVRVIPNLRKGKFLSIILGIVMVLGGLSACAQSGNNSGTTTTTNQGPITIGTSLPLSGDFGPDGKATNLGYSLWQNYINSHGGLLGRQVQFDILNNNSSVTQTGTDYTTLIGTHHDELVVGPFADDYTLAAARSAWRYKYAMVNGTGVAPEVFASGLPNLFSVSLPAANTLNSFALYTLSLPASERPTTAAYATLDDPYLRPIVTQAKQKLEAGGITTVTNPGEIVYSPETTDWTPIADKIIATHAQIVVLGTLTNDAVAFVKRFKLEHYNPQVLVEVSGPDQGSQFTDPIGGTKVAEGIFVPNGGWYPGIKTFGEQEFEQAYVAKYGGTTAAISQDTVQAWSVMQVLQQAAEKIHSIDNAKLMNELRADTFQTVQGPAKFQSDGQNILAIPFLYQWQKSNLIPVYPANDAQQNPEFPKPNWS